MQKDNYSDSIKDFETGIRLNPEMGDIRRFLGMAKLGLNDKQGACSDFISAKALGDPDADELIEKHCK
jgi:hypothetical protein